ncbi:MAG: hypothetical protein IJZ95_07245 [Oscillospiraceae bacterium]|nr:hypothetical protein [Oscillospiraceae bacterium]
MANEIEVQLTGSELKVEISGQNCDVRNDGTDIIYVSRSAGIERGKRGVVSVPAGRHYHLNDSNGAVYLLGTGTVTLAGHDYSTSVFDDAPIAGGDGTIDEQARKSINDHASNADIHLTAEEAIKAAATAISNKNHLINPNFKVNQRGQTEWTSVSFTADRWYMRSLANDFRVTLEGEGLRITNISGTETGGTVVWQRIPLSELDLRNCTVTVSAKISEITGITGLRIIADGAAPAGVRAAEDGIHTVTYEIGEYTDYIGVGLTSMSVDCSALFEWVQFEVGSVATPFVPPNLAEELAKCQRYYQVHTTGDIDPVDLRPSMRIAPTVTQLDNGNYAYDAEF